MRRGPGRTSRGRARRPWPRRSRAGCPPRSRPASSRAGRSARRGRRATIPGRCAPGRRRRRGGAAGGARRRLPAAWRRRCGVSGSGGKIRIGRGAAGGGQPAAGAVKAAAISVALFSGMWLSAGCRRISASSPSRAPIRPRRSAMPSASPACRAAAAAVTASWPRCWRGPSGSTASASSRMHLDAEARVDLAELERQQRADRLAAGRRGGPARPRAPRAPPSVRTSVSRTRRAPWPAAVQPGAERRQQPVDAGEHVGLEPDRLGEGQAQREDVGRPRRRDRLGGAAERLVEPAPDACGPSRRASWRARQRRHVGDPAQAERLQRRDLLRLEPQRRHRQRRRYGRWSRPAARCGRRPAGRAAGGGGAPPRSQRRFWARERVARASWSMASPACGRPGAGAGIARHRPGGADACRRGRAGAMRPKSAASASTCGREPRLAAEEMRAAGDVEHQRLAPPRRPRG